MQEVAAPPKKISVGRFGRLSLNLKICLAATLLLILSLGITSTVIGMQSSDAAELGTMDLARTAAREVAKTLQSRILSNMSVVQSVAAGVSGNLAAGHPPTRDQLSEQSKAVLNLSPDFIGTAISMEPNALDGRDADFAGKKPMYDDTGRYWPYWTRAKTGGFNLEPIVFVEGTPGANDWYTVPQKTGKIFLTEPYAYPVDGVDVQMSTISVPIMVKGVFKGLVSSDFPLSGLSKIIADLHPIAESSLAMISSEGVYAAHADAALIGKKASDISADGLLAVKQGKAFEYVDSKDWVHLLQPLSLHPDLAVWSVRISFPQKVATASARGQFIYALVASLLCACVAAVVMVALMNRLMTPLRALGAAVEDLSSGDADLTVRLNVRGNDELAAIGSGFNAFTEKIHGVLAQVRQSAQGVATASAEIAQGNNDLSARTESQASSLEETAASMEQLSATVKQNADSARQANSLAAQASAVAIQGGEVVGQVVETMKGINDASRRIADIISVIDGIAFQTNILALNAAVEAARAGEQGRGFAVVASEVRSLAGRSADAAKEIKSLINASVERVELGSMQVDKAGKTMQEVVSSVGRVTAIMGEISAASSEQASGVAQIGEAVSSMDQVTQQNAALVEQMAAAASSLNGQADDLVKVVGVFKLGDEQGLHVVAGRVPPAAASIRPAANFARISRPTALASSGPRKSAAKPLPATKARALPAQKTAPKSAQDDWETF